jgi:hypothetical protein
MERDEALARLGLDGSATREDIDSAWRAAMKEVHPDTGSNPDGKLAIELNQARATALSGLPQSGSDLITVDRMAELIRTSQQELVAAERAGDRAMAQVTMHHVGALAFQRRQRARVAAASGGVAAVLGVIAALLRASPTNGLDVVRPVLFVAALTLGLFAAVLAVLAWQLAAREHWLQMELEDAGETLSERAALSDALTELGVGDFFTRAELLEALSRWDVAHDVIRGPYPVLPFMSPTYEAVPLAHTAGIVGPVDFAKLMLAKGVESGLLREDQRLEGDRVVYGYRRT